MNIVLANSIGVDRRGNYIIHSPSRWTESVRSRHHWFAYYPWELAYAATILKHQTSHTVRLVDGCLERLNFARYLARILSYAPDWLVMESASRMIAENLALALAVKRARGATVVFVGQHASAAPAELLAAGVDYVCIGEYEESLLALCSGQSAAAVAGVFPQPRRPLLDVGRLPWPEDTDVSRFAYAVPGEPSSEYREIQMYASRGCPQGCDFCVARHVYYAQPNWRPRPVPDIIAEIQHLRHNYPAMEGVFFDEEVHNGTTKFIQELTMALRAADLHRLHYEAMCDVRLLNEQQLVDMRAAGYYKIRLGIESADQSVQQYMNKHIDPEHVQRMLRIARRLGLKTYGTIMVGAPGATAAADRATIDWMCRLMNDDLLNNAQVSVCTPQPGTPLYSQAIANGWLRSRRFVDFDGGRKALLNYPGYPARRILRLKHQAFRARDHAQLSVIMRSGLFWSWVADRYVRYGWWGIVQKAWRRLHRELLFFLDGARR